MAQLAFVGGTGRNVDHHAALGVDTDWYGQEVFRKTSALSAQIFPITLDIDHPRWLPSLKRLTTVQAMMQRGVAAAQNLFAVIDAPAERDEGKVDVARCRGDLELRGVVMRYEGTAEPALRGMPRRRRERPRS